ncbi:hypothetical protein G6F35_016087 [Rhizopus arrhizus]|nr:hypothetical protein G6F35_016087 [Rhizopus arrhizus]
MHAPETHSALAALHPMKRMGEVADVTQAVLYLEDAGFVTGEILHVDGGQMPYVNIKVTREGTAPGATATTPEQKRALIKGVSDLLFEVLGKPHASTFVVIDEVDMENWGVGGVTVPEYRAQQAKVDK